MGSAGGWWWWAGSLAAPASLVCLLLWQKASRARASLKDKVVFITGATSGLGEACAEVFYKAGCKVILGGRNEERLKEVVSRLKLMEPGGHPPRYVLVDLEQLSSLPGVVQGCLALHGRVDILVNNAGCSYRGRVDNTDISVDQKLMLVNYFGHVALTKALLPHMVSAGGGHIVAISSVQGKLSIPYRSAYSASKHALQAFFDCLRAEMADKKIGVSVISPGYIKTNLSVNAVTGDGTKYGVADSTTELGMNPQYVAERVKQAVEYGKVEVVLSSSTHLLAVWLRNLLPHTFARLMASRARKQRRDYEKTD